MLNFPSVNAKNLKSIFEDNQRSLKVEDLNLEMERFFGSREGR